MFIKPTGKQINTAVSTVVLAGVISMMAYAANFFTPANQPVGFVGQPDLSNFNLSSGNERLYRGEYTNGTWEGKFSCYPIDATGYVNLNTPCFVSGASSPLDIQAASNVRNIGTRKDDATGTGIGFIFTSLSTTQQGATSGVVSSANVDFIRGKTLSMTGGKTRTTVLGDIVHSNVKFWKDATNPTVFVGANDGMLHAFNGAASGVAGIGQERWAYIPSMLIPKLKNLTTTTHDYFVDGTLTIGKIGSGGSAKTILVGTLGAGGKGIYALDISTLTATSDLAAGQKGLWEITNTTLMGPTSYAASTSYADLGDTYSRPLIAKTNSGDDVVIVGNGYNNVGTGTAVLYVINAATGALIKKIDTNSGSKTSPNGLSSPTMIDKDQNGTVDLVYAGDIDGNMWKFDLTSSSPTSWSTSTTPLFTTSPAQAITGAPVVQVHPRGGYMVNFGTGRMLSSSTAGGNIDDSADTTVFYAYGIWDGAPNTATTLITQSLTTRDYVVATGASAVAVRSFTTNNQPNWASNNGWKVALPAGERVVGDGASSISYRYSLTTHNPTTTYTLPGNTTPFKGKNWLMQIDYLTGGAPALPFFDLNMDGKVTAIDRIKYTTGIDTIPTGTVAGDPIMAASGVPVGYSTSNGVQSQALMALDSAGNTVASLYNQNYNIKTTGSTNNTNTTGVNGGHFDVDIAYLHSSTTFGQGGTDTHNHEYDKAFDTNGLNFLNPNDTTLALKNAVSTATTEYKVLVMNQAWNRAMHIKVGTTDWSTKDYQTGTANASGSYNLLSCAGALLGTKGVGCLNLASLPIYTGNTSVVKAFTTNTSTTTGVTGKITVTTVETVGSIGCGGMQPALPAGTTSSTTPFVAGSNCTTTKVNTGARDTIGGLEFSMPVDGFNIQDWWNDGVVQTGVMPTAPSCPDSMNNDGTLPANGTGIAKQYTGPNGERHDGVLTVQIIKANTPNADVQMNVPGQPKYGFRVIDTKITTDVLAEYTLYWHHPSGVCMGDATSVWKVTNNEKDPWWPAQETVPTGFKSGNASLAAADIVKLGQLTCYQNNTPQASGTPTWSTTAFAAANTAPYTVPAGSASAGPKGWTMQPLPDTATTYPPCPIYNSASDDPRGASFISPTTTTTTTTTTTISGGINPRPEVGGSLKQITTTTTTDPLCGTAGHDACPCTGANCPCVKNCEIPNQPAARRLSWRELLKN